MDWSNKYFLHIYKSRLYDLMNVDSSTNTVNIHHWYREWFKIVQDCFQAQDIVYYQWMGEEYRIVHVSTNHNVSYSMSSQSADALFHYHSLSYNSEIGKDTFAYDIGFKLMKKNSTPLGILFVQGSQISMSQLFESDLLDFALESEQFLKKMNYFYKIVEDEQRYRELYKVTEIFHSTMDIDLLLKQVITTLYRVFPDYSFNLLLSNDHHKHEGLPIKGFEYDTADLAAMQSFVNGTIEIADSTHVEHATLYAPLKGKQGVYGVLEVCSTHSFSYPEYEVEFIRLLAYTAGSALENAKLYQQSKSLITDLQLINEISHKLNSDLRMSETLSYLKVQIDRSFQASAVAFIMINQGEEQVLNESSSFFFSENGNQYIRFVKDRIVNENESLFIGDISTKLEGQIPYFSLMAVPMVQKNLIKGFCIVLQEKPYSFSFDMYKLLQSFIHHSTLALTNSMLREKLEKMVITDHLTSLYARRYLDDEMKKSMKRDDRGSYILMDLDNFKEINDRYGHQVGDEVLIQTARVIQRTVEGKGLPARWGGEEIAVYFPNYSAAESKVIADEIVKRIPKETSPSITVSCGISSWEDHNDINVKSLIRRADSALYVAKNKGRNQVVMQHVETSIK
ncbi:diguanylate cyclase (GGDEF)-like protein [Bacillus pakistanensis]|uniref:Diguanylate cyclase (GGDEF)-like protein n=1 Tax=Rossellomorea pakistanensis TaxID=992288 RepID=A0ABS2NAV8_9BACI|nr:sensor domain-containing diguanylate cyclase [Bacillus pakistanensis]MBM7584978.1 diguanylate cyclase (GGDEF)-like protein [Bacillus pakistanensis]